MNKALLSKNNSKHIHLSAKNGIIPCEALRACISDVTRRSIDSTDVWKYPGGNSRHESCSAVHKFIRVRIARCKVSQICSIWGFKWSMKVFKVRRVFLGPFCRNSWRMGCRIVLLYLSKSVEMHNGDEWV